MKKIRVFLADHSTLFREGLAGILEPQPDFVVAGEAGSGQEVAAMAHELKPDLILMDVVWPDGNGLELVQEIKRDVPEVTIIALTAIDDEGQLLKALRCGARGYMLKSIASRDMLRLLRATLQGKAAFMPATISQVAGGLRGRSRGTVLNSDEEEVSLTAREQEVLNLVAEGARDKDVADELHISLFTAKSHMRNILAKLQVSTRHEAARLVFGGRQVVSASH